jgi:hypothetical protein
MDGRLIAEKSHGSGWSNLQPSMGKSTDPKKKQNSGNRKMVAIITANIANSAELMWKISSK